MWDDINNRKDELMKNGIISSFVNSTMFVNPQDDCQDLFTLDKEIEPDSVAIPLGADSSQVKAIRDCAQGLSFVLDGPPGTGKSQTIVNMIANAMYKGKTVLFVAEKMAALNVVKKRLEKLSLGNFILEMHSNKANKKEVLRQIGDSLNCGKIKDPDQFSLLTAELTAKKKELNLLIAKLSKKKYAYSLSDCITRYESLKDFEYPKCNEDNKALTQTQEQRRVIEDDIETLKTLSSSRGEYSDNPFHYFDIKDYYPSLEEFIVRDSNDFLSSFSSLYLSYQELMKVMSIKIIPDFASLEGLYKLCILLTKEKLFFKGILSSEYGENREGNRKLVLVGKDYNDSMKKIRVYFRDDVLNCNSRADIVLLDPDQSFLKKILNHHKVVKELKPYLCSKEVRLPKKNELLALVKEIKKATFSKQYLKDNDSFLRTLLGEEYEKNTGDFSLISHYLDTIDFLLDNFDKLFDHTDSKGFTDNVNVVLNFYMNIDTFSNRSYAENFIMDYERSQKAYQILKDKYSFNENKLVITDGFFDTIIYKFSDMKASPLSFKDILTFNSLIDKLSTEGVYQPVISMFVKGDFPSTDFMEYLNVTYYSSLIKAYFADSYYHEFNGLIFTAAINKYKSIIEDYNALMIKEIAASVTSKYPLANFNYAESTNIFKLQKLVKNGGLRTSIRNILTEFEDLIRTLCPCFLMSPLSAAQYLSVSSKKFDIVIFDEASQIPTSEAIGAISRGNSLIVAGDPQQMPPTNFFKSTLSNDDDYIDIKDNFDDLESLLDDCLALGLKRNRLLWHYRSQHESLIAFSNNYFYDHELYTFPTPDYSSSRLSFNYIPDGIFSNGVNMKEADAIVEEVKRRFDDPKLCHKTIGIVTFNIKQQDLIQEKLFYFFDNNPDMMTINNENSEPLFIKNLENVQGDERDIIIFSVGFGFTKNHNFSLNFGPLSLNKGERRLNVAITRARERMLVYSSIHGSDISSERAKNKGAEVLKKFLLYAQYGTKNLIIENNQQTNIEPGIEKYIAKDLKKLGYDCDIDIGDSKFKIDLAIKDKEGKYILGIILDSTTYLSSPMCRDRNYVQISMLGRLEWKIIRVYTLDYFNDRQRTIADITSAISNISNIRSEEYVPLKTNEIEFEKVEINAFKRAKEYQVCNPSLKLEYDSLSEMVYPQLVDELTRIIDQEGPISEIMLLEKFKEILSVTKAGVKVRRILDLNLKSVPRRVVIEPFGRMFYPNDITGDNINYYRKSTLEQRDVSLVSLGEIKSMLLDILDTQGKIFYSDTVKFIATILGYKNVTAACQLKVSRLVDAAITRFPQFVKDGQWLKKLGMK